MTIIINSQEGGICVLLTEEALVSLGGPQGGIAIGELPWKFRARKND